MPSSRLCNINSSSFFILPLFFFVFFFFFFFVVVVVEEDGRRRRRREEIDDGGLNHRIKIPFITSIVLRFNRPFKTVFLTSRGMESTQN